MVRLLCLCWVLVCLLPTPAAAQRIVSPDANSVRVCPAEGQDGRIPDFSAPACRTIPLAELDPQGRHLWAAMTLRLAPAALAQDRPLGLFVHAKASSEAFLNGVRLGANGRPGESPRTERPGLMDAVFFVPGHVLREGENRLVLRMSAHHGSIRLARPVHQVLLGPYRSATARLSSYWPSLVTFGLFLAGFAYFGVSALRGEDKEGSAIVALASLAAALQLASEAARGILAYPYPLHDLRLGLILLFAMLLGLALFAYALHVLFAPSRRIWLVTLAGLAAILAAAAAFAPGFDLKTLFVLILAALASAVAGAIAWATGRRGGRAVALTGGALAAAMVAIGTGFLDLHLYVALAALLLFLFVRQAQVVARDRKAHRAEQARADELSRALARIESERSPRPIALTSGGRTDYVEPARIVRFSGAGDYVEVHLQDGRSGLYDGSLAALEGELPPDFIRVHRSHIVNAAFIEALERDPAGTGRLQLSGGSEVPVSRRIMPRVRQALAGG